MQGRVRKRPSPPPHTPSPSSSTNTHTHAQASPRAARLRWHPGDPPGMHPSRSPVLARTRSSRPPGRRVSRNVRRRDVGTGRVCGWVCRAGGTFLGDHGMPPPRERSPLPDRRIRCLVLGHLLRVDEHPVDHTAGIKPQPGRRGPGPAGPAIVIPVHSLWAAPGTILRCVRLARTVSRGGGAVEVRSDGRFQVAPGLSMPIGDVMALPNSMRAALACGQRTRSPTRGVHLGVRCGAGVNASAGTRDCGPFPPRPHALCIHSSCQRQRASGFPRSPPRAPRPWRQGL